MREKTWILLASENAVPLHVTLHQAPPNSPRPVEVFLITDQPPEVLQSAQRGCQAAWAAAKGMGLDLPNVTAGFDLAGVTQKSPVTGESAGLAFAVALLQRQLGFKRPVAATGIVSSGIPPGPLERVEGFGEKCRAVAALARQCGPDPGLLFLFPKANAEEFDKGLAGDGVEPIPVESVEEAVSILLKLSGHIPATGPLPQERQKGRMGPALAAAALFIVAAAVGSAFYSGLIHVPSWTQDAKLHSNGQKNGTAQDTAVRSGDVTRGNDATHDGRGLDFPLLLKKALESRPLPSDYSVDWQKLEGGKVEIGRGDGNTTRLVFSIPPGWISRGNTTTTGFTVELIGPGDGNSSMDSRMAEFASIVIQETVERLQGKDAKSAFLNNNRANSGQGKQRGTGLKPGGGKRLHERGEGGGDSGFE